MEKIKWKDRSKKLKPAVLFEKLASERTISPKGDVSFAGSELQANLPAIHSMLEFPSEAADIDTVRLTRLSIFRVKKELTKDNFLNTINSDLKELIVSKQQTYYLLTSLSVAPHTVQKNVTIFGAELSFLTTDYPRKFKSRTELLATSQVPLKPESNQYCKVIIKVKARTHNEAVIRALRAIDFQRALWCMLVNPQMQFLRGSPTQRPINVIRLGSIHTLHIENGEPAKNGLWYEPNYLEAENYCFKDPKKIKSINRLFRLRLLNCSYADTITSALLKFVRALDGTDANTVYLGLWVALEILVIPEKAKYDRLISRCAYLFQDAEYHHQMLEHLREYRNTSVHTGEDTELARENCLQLQYYFVQLILFHINHAKDFTSLEEANNFLDLPSSKVDLKRRLLITKKALRFVS
jgi:hypothetical protein